MVERPLVIAHRGASGYRPEHTASAYRLALALGADAVEPDLVPSADGVLVVRHENELSASTDVADRPGFAGRRTRRVVDGAALEGWFAEDFAWDELAGLRAREPLPHLRDRSAGFDGLEPILRLTDLLDLLEEARTASGSSTVLVAEIKHPDYFARRGFDVARLFAEAIGDRPRGRLIVESFDASVLEELGRLDLAAERVQLIDGALAHDDLERYARLVDGIAVPKSLLLPDETALVERAHGAGLLVLAWTLRAENAFLEPAHRGTGDPAAFGRWEDEFAAVIATGVDGVFADQPDLVVSLLPGGAGDGGQT